MEVVKKEDLYHIVRHVGKQGPLSPVGNQAIIENLAIGKWTYSNVNYQSKNNRTTAQMYGVSIPPKETTATKRQRDLLVEVKTNTFYRLRTIANKV